MSLIPGKYGKYVTYFLILFAVVKFRNQLAGLFQKIPVIGKYV